MTTEADLNVIEARAAAATKGPWKVRPYMFSGSDRTHRMIHTPHGCMWNDWDGLNSDEDGEFIVHAREDVPALVAALRQAYARISEMEAKCPND